MNMFIGFLVILWNIWNKMNLFVHDNHVQPACLIVTMHKLCIERSKLLLIRRQVHESRVLLLMLLGSAIPLRPSSSMLMRPMTLEPEMQPLVSLLVIALGVL
ncbi:hypothetical protein V6N13_046923 [Hibiscus sabdariffa]